MANDKGFMDAGEQMIHEQAMIAQRAVTSSHKTLILDHENKRLPEPLFKEHFLDFFTGKMNPNESEKMISTWINIAGSQSGRVDVFDKDGKVLFTVPPVVGTLSMEQVSRHQKITVSQMAEDYDLRKNNPVAGAARHLNMQVDAKVAEMAETEGVNKDDAAAWDKIFKYYGIITGDPEAPASTTHEDDDLDYE